jgi:hypothetical protein
VKKLVATFTVVGGLIAFGASASTAVACLVSNTSKHCYSLYDNTLNIWGIEATIDTSCAYLNNNTAYNNEQPFVDNEMWLNGATLGTGYTPWVEAGLIYDGSNNDFFTASTPTGKIADLVYYAYPSANWQTQTDYTDTIQSEEISGGNATYYAVNDGPLPYTWINSGMSTVPNTWQAGSEFAVENPGQYGEEYSTLSSPHYWGAHNTYTAGWPTGSSTAWSIIHFSGTQTPWFGPFASWPSSPPYYYGMGYSNNSWCTFGTGSKYERAHEPKSRIASLAAVPIGVTQSAAFNGDPNATVVSTVSTTLSAVEAAYAYGSFAPGQSNNEAVTLTVLTGSFQTPLIPSGHPAEPRSSTLIVATDAASGRTVLVAFR